MNADYDVFDNDPFHTVGSIFVGETSVTSIRPDTTIAEALKIMRVNRFSQLPIVENGKIQGVFSFWSLTRHIIETSGKNIKDPVVEDVMEVIPTVKVTDSLHEIMSLLKQHESLIVESPHEIQAILTTSDVLEYFYNISKAYILVQEIELALRTVISARVPGHLILETIQRSLVSKYKDGRPLPTAIEEMEFNDYIQIICNKQNWEFFNGILGRDRKIVSAKLQTSRKIRDQVMHFRPNIKRQTTLEQHIVLSGHRDWLLAAVQKLRREEEIDRKGQQNGD